MYKWAVKLLGERGPVEWQLLAEVSVAERKYAEAAVAYRKAQAQWEVAKDVDKPTRASFLQEIAGALKAMPSN